MAAVGAPPLFHVAAAMAYFTSSSSGQGSSSSSPTPSIPFVGHTGLAEPTSSLPFDISEFMLSEDIPFLPPPPPMAAAAALASCYEPAGTLLPASPVPESGGFAHEHQQTNTNFGNFPVNSGSTSSVSAEGSRREETTRIAFRMKSEKEIVDDGFKWRKYGKKSVKNSPNPRNYYRCSTEGCSVKKRVEREREDPSYVITTYEGSHNHVSPGIVYYTTQDRFTGQYYVAGCEMPPATSSSS